MHGRAHNSTLKTHTHSHFPTLLFTYYHANSCSQALLIGEVSDILSNNVFFFVSTLISLTLRKSAELGKQQKHLRIHKLVLLS